MNLKMYYGKKQKGLRIWVGDEQARKKRKKCKVIPKNL